MYCEAGDKCIIRNFITRRPHFMKHYQGDEIGGT
jgi:hypothetical protein